MNLFLVQAQPRKIHLDITEKNVDSDVWSQIKQKIANRCLFIKYIQKKNVVSHLLQKN